MWQPRSQRARAATESSLLFQQPREKPPMIGLTPENLRLLVELPEGENRLEWIAANVLDFYNQTNMIYGLVFARCTEETCSIMRASSRFEYLWADSENYRVPTELPAPKYIEVLMAWVDKMMSDGALFPTRSGAPFPSNFMDIACNIFKRLFRVYAHIFHHHLHEIIGLGAEAHLTSSCMHLIFFIRHFGLVQEADLLPLRELIAKYETS